MIPFNYLIRYLIVILSIINFVIAAVNDDPILSAIGNQQTAEDADKTIDLTASDVDIVTDGQTLTYSASSSDETLVIVSTTTTTDGTSGTLTFDVQPDQHGSASITVRVTDNLGLFAEEQITLTVTEINDQPTADASSFTVDEDNIPADPDHTLTGADGDPMNNAEDNQSLTFILVNQAQHGTVVLSVNGEVRYTPNLNHNNNVSSDSFTYKVQDNGTTAGVDDFLDSVPATVNISITPVNDPPEITYFFPEQDTLIYTNIFGNHVS